MKMYKMLLGIISFCVLGTSSVFAQGGDQILDGIGETALIARYTFTRDANDRSRNNLNASIQGTGVNYVNDSLFRRVLSLPGDGEAYISIPGDAVTGEESLSITGWIYLRSAKRGQIFFDFGRNNKSHLFVAPAGTDGTESFQAQVITESDKFSVSSTALRINRWQHL